VGCGGPGHLELLLIRPSYKVPIAFKLGGEALMARPY